MTPEIKDSKETESRKSILIVEDHLTLRQVWQSFLRRDYEVVAVKTAEETWEQLNQKGFDLLLTDNQLPDASGLELIQTMRASNQKVLEEMPVILASSLISEHLKQVLEPLNATAMEKSFKLEELKSRIDLLINPADFKQE